MIKDIFNRISRAHRNLGVEFTDHHVKLCEIHTTQKSNRVFNHVQVPLPDNVINDGRIQDLEQLRLTLQKAIDAKKWGTRRVHFAIPSQTVMVRILKMPDVPYKELRKIVDFEVKHNIHFPFDDPYYDFVKLSDQPNVDAPSKADVIGAEAAKEAAAASELPGESQEGQPTTEKTCDIMLVAAPLDMLQQYIELFADVELKLQSMEIKAFSLLRLLERMANLADRDTVLLVDVNESNCDLTIVHNGMIQITRNIPASFTQKESAKENDLDQLFAEFVNKDADFENACSELISEIERLMNFYRYTLNNRDQEFKAIWISGDIPLFDKLMAVMSERLVQPIFPMNWNVSTRESINTAAMAVPIGLGLRGGVT